MSKSLLSLAITAIALSGCSLIPIISARKRR